MEMASEEHASVIGNATSPGFVIVPNGDPEAHPMIPCIPAAVSVPGVVLGAPFVRAPDLDTAEDEFAAPSDGEEDGMDFDEVFDGAERPDEATGAAAECEVQVGGASGEDSAPSAAVAAGRAHLRGLTQINKMKVKEAQAACNVLGLPSTGVRADLVERLRQWYKKTTPQTAAREATAARNAATAARWVDVDVANSNLPHVDYAETVHGPRPELHYTSDTRPIQFFNDFISPDLREKWADYSNKYANNHKFGTPDGPYQKTFIRPDREQVDKMLATYILNGLHPYPDMLLYFIDSYGYNDSTVQKLWRGREYYKSFKACFHVSDPDTPTEDILYKVRELIDHLRVNCEGNFILPAYVSLDEQDIGFQGRMAELKEKIKSGHHHCAWAAPLPHLPNLPLTQQENQSSTLLLQGLPCDDLR